eukprot:TRINITY_DN7273_c0_g1_i3.p1 TRINITY_DN7273_c0_g1~~TRINITY_DN7273_c0_g1_i3.p1  ORF type:complete len:886 (+),score=57.85 TRINITY_DN7273_c0_g1_i3:79-2658(+)
MAEIQTNVDSLVCVEAGSPPEDPPLAIPEMPQDRNSTECHPPVDTEMALVGNPPIDESELPEEVSELIRRNRLMQERLRKALVAVEDARQAGIEHRLKLQRFIDVRRFKLTSRRQRLSVKVPDSFFSSHDAPSSAPPKNFDGIRRSLFREKELGALTYRTLVHWRPDEDAALQEALRKDLLQSAFKRMYRQRRMNGAGAAIPTQQLFRDLSAELKQLTTNELFEQEDFKTDWKRVSRELARKSIKRDERSCFIRFVHHLDPKLNRAPWSKEEDKILLQLVSKHRGLNWELVCREMGTGRTAFGCINRYMSALNPDITKKRWTEEDDCRVHMITKQNIGNTYSWIQVCARLGGGFAFGQTRQRSVRNTKMGRWSAAEIRRLEFAVHVYGPKRWSNIAFHLRRSRNSAGQRCEQLETKDKVLRITNWTIGQKRRTVPHNVYQPWTAEEDEALVRGIEEFGLGNWQTLRKKVLPGRTASQISYRFWKLNPVKDGVRLADIYGTLLVSRRKMMPRYVAKNRKKVVPTKLTAGDFDLPIEEVFVEDKFVCSNGKPRSTTYVALNSRDPEVERDLQRLNIRRRTEARRTLQNPDQDPVLQLADQASFEPLGEEFEYAQGPLTPLGPVGENSQAPSTPFRPGLRTPLGPVGENSQAPSTPFVRGLRTPLGPVGEYARGPPTPLGRVGENAQAPSTPFVPVGEYARGLQTPLGPVGEYPRGPPTPLGPVGENAQAPSTPFGAGLRTPRGPVGEYARGPPTPLGPVGENAQAPSTPFGLGLRTPLGPVDEYARAPSTPFVPGLRTPLGPVGEYPRGPPTPLGPVVENAQAPSTPFVPVGEYARALRTPLGAVGEYARGPPTPLGPVGG